MLVREASDLQLPPGRWPTEITLTLTFKLAKTEYTGQGEDRELAAAIYRSDEGDELHVLND